MSKCWNPTSTLRARPNLTEKEVKRKRAKQF
jgi:hypothetical protein